MGEISPLPAAPSRERMLDTADAEHDLGRRRAERRGADFDRVAWSRRPIPRASHLFTCSSGWENELVAPHCRSREADARADLAASRTKNNNRRHFAHAADTDGAARRSDRRFELCCRYLIDEISRPDTLDFEGEQARSEEDESDCHDRQHDLDSPIEWSISSRLCETLEWCGEPARGRQEECEQEQTEESQTAADHVTHGGGIPELQQPVPESRGPHENGSRPATLRVELYRLAVQRGSPTSVR